MTTETETPSSSSPTSFVDPNWATLEDPIGFDFFGFDFDFTGKDIYGNFAFVTLIERLFFFFFSDYADDSFFESDGSLKDGSFANSPNEQRSSNSSSNQNIQSVAETTVGKRPTSSHDDDAAAAAQLKRQKIEQYAAAMRKTSNSSPNVVIAPSAPPVVTSAPTPAPAPVVVVKEDHFQTFAATKRVKKKSKTSKSGQSLPPAIEPNDFRRTFTRTLLYGFNSCDLRTIKKVMEDNCVPEVVAIHRYEGKPCFFSQIGS
jgi:hypothetical protein